MSEDIITTLYQKGNLAEIDVHFARFIGDISCGDDAAVVLAAALVSSATGEGNVCLDLKSMAGKLLFEGAGQQQPMRCPALAAWREQLHSCPAVGRPGDCRPLILDDRDRLYLYRYWEYERKLADAVMARAMQDGRNVDAARLGDGIERFFPVPSDGRVNWQKVAAAAAMFRKFTVISGGPGTGKTTTVAKILAILLEQAPTEDLRIYLAAPTGKAAARLKESIKKVKKDLSCSDRIKSSIPEEASTIHRMLQTIPGSPYFRHDWENPLAADVVVVDEASMVDLALMSKLVQAVPMNAHLILLGDKDQLASVEAGAVLGDICDREKLHGFSNDFCREYENLTGEPLAAECRYCHDRRGLYDCIVHLHKSYRFGETSGIGEVSRAVNRGDFEKAVHALNCSSHANITWENMRSPADLFKVLEKEITRGYAQYLKAEDPARALDRFNQFKILCAVRKGAWGVDAINRLAEQVLRKEGLIAPNDPAYHPWYRGRPILITRNDYRLGLFNGDIGVIMPLPGSASGESYAFFPGNSGETRRFSPHRLPEHETVYAMTVHKSQGSEFENILLILPEKDYPVLTRELLYTGLTRARQRVSLWGNERVLKTTISRKIRRTSGLRDVLWP